MICGPAFACKVLLEHCPAHALTYLLWLCSCYSGLVEYLWQRPHGHWVWIFLMSGSLRNFDRFFFIYNFSCYFSALIKIVFLFIINWLFACCLFLLDLALSTDSWSRMYCGTVMKMLVSSRVLFHWCTWKVKW